MSVLRLRPNKFRNFPEQSLTGKPPRNFIVPLPPPPPPPDSLFPTHFWDDLIVWDDSLVWLD